MSYISQNLDAFSFGKETENISRRYHDFFCTIILAAICKRFEQAKVPYTAEELSREHRIPIRLTKRILYELQDMHLIYEAVSDEKGRDITYIPGVDINRLTVGMLLTKLDMSGSEDFKIDNTRYPDSWKVLVKARKEFTEQNNRILLKDL